MHPSNNEKEESIGNSMISSFMEMGGIKEGKKVTYGFISTDIQYDDEIDEDKERRQQQAAIDLVNISPQERNRRIQVGNILIPFAILYASYVTLFIDKGDILGHILRLTSLPFFFLGYGYHISGTKGLWQIAQSSLWDVDGKGLTKIQNPLVAKSILAKVNDLTVDVWNIVFLPIVLFSFVSHDIASSIVFCVLFFTVLYIFKDKIPSNP